MTASRLPARRAGLLLAGALFLALPALCAAQPAITTSNLAPEAPLPAGATGEAIGPGAVPLKNDDGAARDIMRRALDFGQVRTQTGNDAALMERTGVAMRLEREGDAPPGDPDSEAHTGAYRNIAGGYMGGDIDLRFNFDAWRHAYAVTQPGPDGWPTRSLQFFDAQGHALHKLYLTNEVGAGLFERLVMDYRAQQQQRPPAPGAAAPTVPEAPVEKPDSAIDLKPFQQAWLAMTDAGQFGAVLAAFGVTREQALRLAPPGMVRRLAPGALRTLLEEVVRQKLGIMALVGNAGVTQVYTGPLAAVAVEDDTVLARAPGFSLRLRGGALRSGYAVRRAGAVAVEFFDAQGQLAVSLFGLHQHMKAWVELVRDLPKE